MPGWVKQSPWILNGITLAAVTLIGFNLLYLTPPTFGDQGWSSYLGLFLAGFAAQVSGVTLAQLGAKVPSPIG
jgi:hypothetical protein